MIDDHARLFRCCQVTREAISRVGGPRFVGSSYSRTWTDRSMALAAPDSVEEVWALLNVAADAIGTMDGQKHFETAAKAAQIADRLGNSDALWAAMAAQMAIPSHKELALQAEIAERFMRERPALPNIRTTAGLFFGCLRTHLVLGDREHFDAAMREVSIFADKSHDSMALSIAAWAELVTMARVYWRPWRAL